MRARHEWADVPLEQLRACPHCDALYRLTEVRPRERAQCRRCHSVLIAPRRGAFVRIIALALASAVLLVIALLTPFLDLSAAGMHSDASILDATMAFSEGVLAPLSLACAAFIIVIPAIRLALTLYTLVPLVRGRPAARHAADAFRLAERLRPWSMAEIFVIGVAVALVKVSGLASVTPGVAFWTFAILVIISLWQDSYMDREQIWSAIDRARSA
ncbi:paraquat-inducible protein A [Falsirhodobacter algicola]|uniref:Paraquat-inducible protein A n=1 Tax=Falsirhodobacter algicola TaxID=2692330 RepID=A0A8J8SKA8_9RHOB|nr:paraquat-inducible protein A [Falsirhodobacter algicola]QUS35321.1 paraquat-inducible protein A [Falsirhodobacter algicola]